MSFLQTRRSMTGVSALALTVVVTAALTSNAAAGPSNPQGSKGNAAHSAQRLKTPEAYPAVPLMPSFSGPIKVTAQSVPYNGAAYSQTPVDLAARKYVEEEYYLSGRANVYNWVPRSNFDLTMTGKSADYTTRMLIRKPKNPDRDSGRVVVELINTTPDRDFQSDWASLHETLMDRGDTYVGITIRPNVFAGMKRFDEGRYGRLSMPNPVPPEQQACGKLPGEPGFSLSLSKLNEQGLMWDVISQVARMLDSKGRANPLSASAKELYLVGESGSAAFIQTYIRWFSGRTFQSNGQPIYDGYLLDDITYNFITNASLNQCSPTTDPILPDDPQLAFVPPRGVPIMQVRSERFAMAGGSVAERKADVNTSADKYSLWEVAGASHGWKWLYTYGDANDQQLAKAGFTHPGWTCPQDRPEIPFHMVTSAAYVALSQWATKNIAPPKDDRLLAQNGQLVRDGLGNAMGGVRLPVISVPVASYLGVFAQTQDCADIKPLGQDVLRQLYDSKQDYVDSVRKAGRRLVEDGFLLPRHADQLTREAAARDIGF